MEARSPRALPRGRVAAHFQQASRAGRQVTAIAKLCFWLKGSRSKPSNFPLPLALERRHAGPHGALLLYVIARHRWHEYLVLRTKSRRSGRGPCNFGDRSMRPFRDHPPGGRLHPIRFPATVQSKLGANHSFVELELRDEDSLHLKGNIERLTSPNTGPKNFSLQLSNEYTDFHFEPDRQKAAAAVKRQPGGKPSKAVWGMQAVYNPDNCCFAAIWRACFG